MFNPAKAADEIKKEYMGYISTAFHFRDSRICGRFYEELNKTVSNGPYVEIKDAFAKGQSIEQLCRDGILSPLFADLERDKSGKTILPLSRQLYLHQETAIGKIVSGRNVVVSTGTGSGKTYCFLIPVINELLREREAGTLNDGVRAIFIYPMNALANDQIKGLREILMAYPHITFGVYNGGTENREEDAIKLYEAMFANEKNPKLRKRLPNELLSRDEMKKTPPHILFTNYAMLEHLLFRPGDDVLFSKSKFKFVVLDEAHVYAGAVGIETALLLSRLKARLGDSNPQFILTSATLGNRTEESRARVVDFASILTGCKFEASDIIFAERVPQTLSGISEYPEKLFIDLAEGEKTEKQIFEEYGIEYDKKGDDNSNLYDLIIQTRLYAAMRRLGDLVSLDEFIKELRIDRRVAVAFISLCAKAQKNGEILVDIRYHYFLRALDGGYMSLGDPNSFSLTRKNKAESGSVMFEVGMCDDCGEIALIGKIANCQLVRAGAPNERKFFQIMDNNVGDDFFYNEDDKQKDSKIYKLCANCGAIVPADMILKENWCGCEHCKPVLIKSVPNAKCLNCGNGNLRRLQLGYDAATGVIATSLFEQIPEYTFTFEDDDSDETPSPSLFFSKSAAKRRKETTGSQFLVFSDSRQGAAKFACYMDVAYKEFLRRRGLWKVADEKCADYPDGLSVSELVRILDNYYSTAKLFRSSNAPDVVSDISENRRNAWIAVLNELYNSARDTSLVALGKISFEYRGITEDIFERIANDRKIDKESVRALLNYLVFEVVKFGAIRTDSATDINDEDRKYIFFTSEPQVAVKYNNEKTKNAHAFLPIKTVLKSGSEKYYRQNKIEIIKDVLGGDDDAAVKFLADYWDYLIDSQNSYCLKQDGKGFYMEAKSINVRFGSEAVLWRCEKCRKVTQFNIGGKCLHPKCGGKLVRLNAAHEASTNYYAKLYESNKMSPLFIKEHTAQLSKKEALNNQQMFVRKEINALSCSTTFEMGVDVGDLETVFLRNFPPLPSNYAQRVGRAGRSINAAAFALTYARLSSHDFTFFDRPIEMIKGVIYPPHFELKNEKIIKRHIYAVTIGYYLKLHERLYDGNNAKAFINECGYKAFLNWLNSKPVDLLTLLKRSFPHKLWDLPGIQLESFGWLEDFCGENGRFTSLIGRYESDVEYLKREKGKAMRNSDLVAAQALDKKLKRIEDNELIDFLVRGNILPKYGFPVDSVALEQNIVSDELKSLNLSRDLSVAIAEYAPSAEVVADGGLYKSRYIRKPLVNKKANTVFDISYFAQCPQCDHINYSNLPIGPDGMACVGCGEMLGRSEFHASIEPRAGFIAERDVRSVPLTSQERKYRTEAVYVGNKDASVMDCYVYNFGGIEINVQSTSNDTLIVRSTSSFYVCLQCGYALADDETSKLGEYDDHKPGSYLIGNYSDAPKHESPFSKGKCSCGRLEKYGLHHEFGTDVAKLEFGTDTSDFSMMLSVMHAILNAFCDELSIEKRDVRACLTYNDFDGRRAHQIIIYDSVPGGAGHARRLVTQSGDVLRKVIVRAVKTLSNCDCDSSCYKCLRSYDNQQVHELLDRRKALEFLEQFIE